MNAIELSALTQSLSNEARVLYCLYLRPLADKQNTSIEIHNKSILALLNAKDSKIKLGREISALFEELFKAGLVEIEGEHHFDKSLNKQKVRLPLYQITLDVADASVHDSHSKMSVSWRPEPSLFTQLCQLIGLIDDHFDADELGEFIAYWLGRPEVQHSDYQWCQKFVLHLKQRRIRYPHKEKEGETTKVGHQWITAQAGIEFDDNVKKLIDKYSGPS